MLRKESIKQRVATSVPIAAKDYIMLKSREVTQDALLHYRVTGVEADKSHCPVTERDGK